MPKKRSESGQYVETATPDDVLDVFETVEGPPVVLSADVAEATDLSRDSARRKLETLRDRGDVARRKVAGRSLYWPTDYTDFIRDVKENPRAEEFEEPTEEFEEPTEEFEEPTEEFEEPTEEFEELPDDVEEGAHDVGGEDTPAETTERKERSHNAENDLVADVVDDVGEGWDDTPERLAARKGAARAVLQHALDTGDAIGKTEAVDEFHDAHAVDGQNAETWWRKNVRPVLQAVGEYSRGKHGYVVEELPDSA